MAEPRTHASPSAAMAARSAVVCLVFFVASTTVGPTALAQGPDDVHIAGRVHNPLTGEPLANVPISFTQGPESSPSFSVQVHSSANGSFHVSLPEGTTRGVSGGQQVRTTTFDFQATDGLSLDVPAYLGAVRATLRVEWQDAAAASLMQTAPCETDCMGPPEGASQGMYTFGPLPEATYASLAPGFTQTRSYVAPGRYTLEAEGEGAATARASIDLEPGSSWEFEARLAAGSEDLVTVAGVVLDAPTGDAIEGAWIHVRNDPVGFSERSLTDAAGGFSIDTPPGVISIWAWPYRNTTVAPDGQTWYSAHVFGRFDEAVTNLEIPLERVRAWPAELARIQGWVVDPDMGEGVAGARILLSNEDTREWGEAVADADGSFRFDVEAGRYELSAVAPGYPWTTLSFGAAGGTVWANATLLNPQFASLPGWYARQDGPYGVSGPTEWQPVGEASASTGPDGAEPFAGEAAFAGQAGDLGGYDRHTVVEPTETESPTPPDSSANAPSPGTVIVVAVLLGLASIQRSRRSRDSS